MPPSRPHSDLLLPERRARASPARGVYSVSWRLAALLRRGRRPAKPHRRRLAPGASSWARNSLKSTSIYPPVGLGQSWSLVASDSAAAPNHSWPVVLLRRSSGGFQILLVPVERAAQSIQHVSFLTQLMSLARVDYELSSDTLL